MFIYKYQFYTLLFKIISDVWFMLDLIALQIENTYHIDPFYRCTWIHIVLWEPTLYLAFLVENRKFF